MKQRPANWGSPTTCQWPDRSHLFGSKHYHENGDISVSEKSLSDNTFQLFLRFTKEYATAWDIL